jgi:hypothetical protein
VLTVQVKNAAGQTPLRFDILPTAGVPGPVIESQFQLARQIAPVLGTRYYFLVTKDWVRGWRISDGGPIFEQPASSIFAPYVRNDLERLRGAGENFLAELTQAWIADLGQHWTTRGAAPGEGDLAQSGALAFIRSAEAATTGSL